MQIRHWIFVGLIVLAAGYFFYEAKDVLLGPTLLIFEPEDNATINHTEIHIAGQTQPRLEVWISGKKVLSDEKGFFQENLNLFPGYNTIGISVRDRFGSETRKILKLVVK